ncbi:Oidioi.mRNA.OKI2018_I69.XSR.g14446.t1.cds [Oikopleura dioica]|uniref:Oidioi.mRNA.OKI2018_I69.XSR.g14446.t1.cds n=1 Tax=Oikopleura dioica TaxID=34765 RepID=A0ABN7S9W5_OIKDI|nr:Oidioi.mRNA.OKI2018_I69.XSR.g14446.t1.cds [Oikopleura dioica]
MMLRPKADENKYTAEPSKQGSNKNKQLAADFEKKSSVQAALAEERKQEMRQRLGYNSYHQRGTFQRGRGRGRGGRGGYSIHHTTNGDHKVQGKTSFSRIPLSQEELDQELDAYVQKRKALQEQKEVEAKKAKVEDENEIKEEVDVSQKETDEEEEPTKKDAINDQVDSPDQKVENDNEEE